MTRRPTTYLWALVLGIITTLAVAWLSAAAFDLYHADPTPRAFHSSGAAPAWSYSHWRGSTGEGILSIDSSLSGAARTHQIAIGPGWSRTSESPAASQGGDYTARYEEARGWPMLALKSVQTSTDMSLSTWRTSSGFRLPIASGVFDVPRTLGWAPIIPGFVVNVLVFGFLWAVILEATWRMVSRQRFRCGLCSQCGYPTLGLAICPECGMASSAAAATGSPGRR